MESCSILHSSDGGTARKQKNMYRAQSMYSIEDSYVWSQSMYSPEGLYI